MALVLGTPNAELQVVTQTELGKRLDLSAWVQEAGPNDSVYSIAHAEGPVSNCWERIKSSGVLWKYTPVANVADCQAAQKTYYYDTVATTLYVHTSDDSIPGKINGTSLFVIVSFFWEGIGSDIIEISGVPCEPLLDKTSVPNVVQEISMQSRSGSGTSFGTLKFNNADEYFDARLSAYIYQAKKMKCWIGNKGSDFTDFVPYFMGWTGDITLDDEWFSIDIDDYRLYVP